MRNKDRWIKIFITITLLSMAAAVTLENFWLLLVPIPTAFPMIYYINVYNKNKSHSQAGDYDKIR